MAETGNVEEDEDHKITVLTVTSRGLMQWIGKFTGRVPVWSYL